MVQLGEVLSTTLDLHYAVPKVSDISQMILNIYMKLLREVIEKFGVCCYQYYTLFVTNTHSSVSPLQP